jgi:acetyl-CoA carboxylase carboxyl transferase subunit alpha
MPNDLKKMGICDRIIKEPLGGAHREFDKIATKLKKVILEEIDLIRKNNTNSFLDRRIERYDKMGIFSES